MQSNQKATSTVEKRYFNVAEAVQYTGLSMPYIYNLVHTAGFPAVRIGRRILIDREKLDDWLAANKQVS